MVAWVAQAISVWAWPAGLPLLRTRRLRERVLALSRDGLLLATAGRGAVEVRAAPRYDRAVRLIETGDEALIGAAFSSDDAGLLVATAVRPAGGVAPAP